MQLSSVAVCGDFSSSRADNNRYLTDTLLTSRQVCDVRKKYTIFVYIKK